MTRLWNHHDLRAALVLGLTVLTGGCASAGQRANTVTAEVVSEPAGLAIGFRGKKVGVAPFELALGRVEDAVELRAMSEPPPTMERRVRFLGPDRVQVLIRAGEEPSPLARALGLAKVLVFDYGEATSFEVDRYDLKPEARTLLARQAKMLAEAFAGLTVYVCGHTDSTGGSEHNQLLSLKRAEAVSAFLVGEGVEPGRLIAQGFGADYPLAENDTEGGRAWNRRTEIVLPD